MNISFGQYYPVDSPIHKLDPRTKIILMMCFVTFVFISKTILGNFISLAFLLIVVKLSKIPLKIILGCLKHIFFLLIFTTTINIFFNQSGIVLLELSFIKLTTGGLYYAGNMVFRLIILVIASSMLTFTTKTLDFADGLENLLESLKKFNFPAHELSMMITIALRFIPTILEEFVKIKNAQISRGADFETGNLIKKIKSFIPILVPLFVSAFKRASELTVAMESRCYRGDIGRTKLKVLEYQKSDYIALTMLTIYFIILIIIRFTIEIYLVNNFNF